MTLLVVGLGQLMHEMNSERSVFGLIWGSMSEFCCNFHENLRSSGLRLEPGTCCIRSRNAAHSAATFGYPKIDKKYSRSVFLIQNCAMFEKLKLLNYLLVNNWCVLESLLKDKSRIYADTLYISNVFIRHNTTLNTLIHIKCVFGLIYTAPLGYSRRIALRREQTSCIPPYSWFQFA
jgi:hypothetical protein